MPRFTTLIDLLLQQNLFADRSAANAAIMAGDVLVNEQRVDKAGTKVPADSTIRLKSQSRYASRGGEKLHAAIDDFKLQEAFVGKVVVDVGASTGGFTDCCLQFGATKVFAVDVGTNQLAWKLRQDPRVVSLENTDIRDFTPTSELAIDWVVADISFNSVSRVASDLVRIAPKAQMLLLIKPQFELPRDLIPDGGVVVDEEHRRVALAMAKESLEKAGIEVKASVDARPAGRAGNREIFIWGQSGCVTV